MFPVLLCANFIQRSLQPENSLQWRIGITKEVCWRDANTAAANKRNSFFGSFQTEHTPQTSGLEPHFFPFAELRVKLNLSP